MNPWNAVGSFFAELLAQKKAQQWYRLIFSMGVSALVSFLVVGGGAMAASRSFAIGCGSGMVSAGVILAYYVRRSPLTKGMMFVFPSEEAAKEMGTNLQVLQK